MAEMPRPNDNINRTLYLFAARGFDERDMVSLLGMLINDCSALSAHSPHNQYSPYLLAFFDLALKERTTLGRLGVSSF